MRTATRRAAAARSGRARDRARPASSRTTRPRRTAQDRARQPDGAGQRRRQLRARGRARDRRADRHRRATPTRAAARRRDRSADRVPRARGARGRRDAGGGRAARAAAHDRALGEGPRVPHGVRHRARGRPVPAREQPVRGRRRRGGAAPHVRRDHARASAGCTSRTRRAGCCTARSRYHIPSRFVDELPRELVQWLSPRRPGPARSTSTTPSGARVPGTGVDAAQATPRQVEPPPGRPGGSARACATRSSALGVIIDAEGRGTDARVQVNFRDAGVKWLALEYAKLEAA